MLLLLVILTLGSNFCSASLSSSQVTIEDNGYVGLVIAIHPNVEESPDLIDAIKETWTDASKHLYVATENRAFFKQVTILVPKTWTNGTYAIPTGRENYDRADVNIVTFNETKTNQPYTLQYQGCGKPGIKTYYTASYFLDEKFVENYGPRGKVVVHEWAHYRWGVFDETSDENPFYWDPDYGADNGPVATKCPKDLLGDIRNVQSEPKLDTCNLGDLDNATNLYPEYCVFFPYEDQFYNISTSLMSYQYMDDVVKFCKDQGESDPSNTHNIYAPTRQNELCNMQSTWTIIKNSNDSLDWSVNHIHDISELEPDFKIVRSQTARFMLVLDDSGSMDTMDCDGVYRYDCLKTAVYLFLTETVPDNSLVGIVTFGSSATTRHNLMLVNSDQDRQNLANSVATLRGGSGGTCIGCGINEGIKVLENGGVQAAGGQLIVITDGDENELPYVADVANEVITKGVIINTIFIVNERNSDLKDLTAESGGVQYFAEDQLELLQYFTQLSNAESTEDNLYQVHNESFPLNVGTIHTSNVSIDNIVGRSTIFTFVWSYGSSPPDIKISTPSGCYHANYAIQSPFISCVNQSFIDVATQFRIIKFEIPGIAESGNWIYTLDAGSYNYGIISSLVTSAARTQPIIIESGLSKTNVDDGSAAIVYAKVTQGYFPVLGAIVTATITGSSSPKTIDLYDNGAGCDITKNDGIYSRYFTEFTGPGRYSVVVDVGAGPTTKTTTRVAGSRANYRPGTISSDGTVNVNPNGAVSTDGSGTAGGVQSQDLGDFSRVVPSESFDYTGTVNVDVPGASPVDNFPPAKIIDAKTMQRDLQDYNQGIILQFTATGNDFDQGKASGYDIRYTYDDPTDLISNFGSANQITEADMLKGKLSNPSASGQIEEFIVQTPSLPVDATGAVVNNSRLSFSVKAYDSSGNYGEPSNVPVMNFFIAPVVIPSTPPDTTTQPYVETTLDAQTSMPTQESTSMRAETTKAPTATTNKAMPVTSLPARRTTTSKVTVTKSTGKTTFSTTATSKSLPSVECPQCEECDPNVALYEGLATGFAITTGIFMTSTLIISIWLCKVNKEPNKVDVREKSEVDSPPEKLFHSRSQLAPQQGSIISLEEEFTV